jgi:hypothetical protein
MILGQPDCSGKGKGGGADGGCGEGHGERIAYI